MSTLNETQRQQLRTTLEARKEQLLAELGLIQNAHRERIGQAGNSPQDAYATQANRIAQDAVRDAEARRDHDELVAVRAALERMEDGSYGQCLDCDDSIALPRLQAFPAALRCLTCQTQAETTRPH